MNKENEREDPEISPMPAYFLALHSIELSLKSYLLPVGLTQEELRAAPYSHDVIACY